MESNVTKRIKKREKRALRVRRRVRGNAARPRLTVFKSNQHICAQIIDDESGKTLASFGTLSKEVKGTENGRKSKTSARFVGEKIGKMALDSQVNAVVFDRGRYKYHGLIAELAEGARSAGLQF